MCLRSGLLLVASRFIASRGRGLESCGDHNGLRPRCSSSFSSSSSSSSSTRALQFSSFSVTQWPGNDTLPTVCVCVCVGGLCSFGNPRRSCRFRCEIMFWVLTVGCCRYPRIYTRAPAHTKKENVGVKRNKRDVNF